jgi:DNA-binding CsgD family transcriptional regulator
MELSGKQLALIRKAYRLSPRETQMVDLIMRGVERNEDIAFALEVSVLTAKTYVRDLHAKFRTGSKLQLALRVLDTLDEQGR